MIDEALGDLPIAIGLRQQGHMSTVMRMLRGGATWAEIGAAIHWEPQTACEWFARELLAEYDTVRQRSSAMHRRAQKAEAALAKKSASGGSWELPERRQEARVRDRMMDAVERAAKR